MNAHVQFLRDASPVEPSADAFRLAMRQLAGGVSVISTGRGRKRTGLTATSVSSLSLDPATLIVCINRESSVLPVLRETEAFGVNILADGHRAIADRFAGRGGLQGAARYAGGDWITLTTGVSLLADALAAIDCRVETIMEWHTHAVVIGRVAGVHLHTGAPALVHCRADYHSV